MDEWITVATDGACAGNPGPAGWAWVVDDGRWEAGSLGTATNNEAELEAVRRLLLAAPATARLLVLSDSQYTINVVTKWAAGWARAGWVKRDGQPVKNRLLVAELLELRQARRGRFRMEWVAGHAGHPLNEAADRLAVQLREVSPTKAMLAGPGWPH